MKFLDYLNQNLIIYLYIIAIIILAIIAFRLYKEIKITFKEIKYYKTRSENIKNTINQIKEKTDKIKYTTNNTLPLFIQIAMISSFIKALFSKKARRKKEFIRKTAEAVNTISPLINMFK